MIFLIRLCLFASYILISLYAFFGIEHADHWSTIDAINSGHPFCLMDYTSGYLEYVPYSNYLGDHGFELILSALSKLPALSDYQFTGHEVPVISFCILALFNACFLFLPLPNILLICTQIAYIALIFLTDSSMFTGYSNYRGIDWVAPFMSSLFIVSLILDWNAQETKRKYSYIILGSFVGFFALFRQTISFIFQLGLLSIFVGSLFFITKNWKKSFPAFVICKISWAVLGCILFNGLLSFAHSAKHGDGQALYPSLGYVANPYNISWEDENAYVNHILVYDSRELPSHPWAKRMGQLFWDIVKKDPALFFKNIFAKAKKLNEYLLLSKLTDSNQRDICAVTPNQIHKFAYIFSLICIFALCIAMFYRKQQQLQLLFLFFCILGLLFASAAPAILVFPGYYASFLGFLFCMTFIFAPFIFTLLKESKELSCDGAVKKRMGISILALLTMVTGFTLFQAKKNRSEAQTLLSDSDPMQRIKKMGYKYGYLFNRLEKEEQEKILSKLGTSLSDGIFSPKFLFIQEKEDREYCEAHIIAYLSHEWTPPIPKADQGPSATYISLAKGNQNFTNTSFEYKPQSSVFNRITDQSWNGKYIFLTLPVSKEFIENPEKITVSAWEMLHGAEPESIVYKEIGSSPMDQPVESSN